MELQGRWKRGRSQRRFMDEVKEAMQRVDETEEDAGDRVEMEADCPLWQPLKGAAEEEGIKAISADKDGKGTQARDTLKK